MTASGVLSGITRWAVEEGTALAVLQTLPDACVQTCVTSPPYFGLRSYLPADHPAKALEMGSEPTLAEFVAALVGVLAEVRRVLRDDGTLWLNLGDSYEGSFGSAGRQGASGQMAGRAVVSSRIARRAIEGAGGAVRPGAVRPGAVRPKCLMGVPWRVAFALQDDGWTLRSEIIWYKLNPMPESVEDRPTKAHEHLFLLSKRPTYYYDADAIREPHQDLAGGPERFGDLGQRNAAKKVDQAGLARSRQVSKVAPAEGYHPLGRNARTVWSMPSAPFSGAHFATFPPALPRRCILAGSRVGDVVLDPFCGSGTTGLVADAHQRRFIGIELNPASAEMARDRIRAEGAPLFSQVAP